MSRGMCQMDILYFHYFQSILSASLLEGKFVSRIWLTPTGLSSSRALLFIPRQTQEIRDNPDTQECQSQQSPKNVAVCEGAPTKTGGGCKKRVGQFSAPLHTWAINVSFSIICILMYLISLRHLILKSRMFSFSFWTQIAALF